MTARMPTLRRPWSLVVTCEHGGYEVPGDLRPIFRGKAALLRSHRGWDAGALYLARELAARLDAPLLAGTTTRLLVDLNRSWHNPRVFSNLTRHLSRADRVALLDRLHRPHWDAVRATVSHGITQAGRVLHLAIHSFTPVLDGVVRRPDLALLYDPARRPERALAVAWARALSRALPDRVVGRNDPYRGSADGLTTALRKSHGATRYLGIEIEVNQKHVGRHARFPKWVGDALVESLQEVLA